tara:strand:+ start:93 stop:416 length:324 start_codon:yes stop_codon:yes gene_type:complete
MEEIYTISLLVASVGIITQLIPKLNSIYIIYTTDPLSANNINTNIIISTISSNSCFLFYMIINKQYIMIINCIVNIFLDFALIYMKNTIGKIKKSSSQTNLLDLETN